jgi:hypothetical protein
VSRGPRALDSRDIGRVFVRVDREGDRGEYLYFRSLGTGSAPVASFVRFRVTGSVAHDIGDMGYFNGPWYQEVRQWPEPFMADVLTRYEKQVEERLVDLREATRAEERRHDRLRTRFGKPASWTPLGEGPTAGKVSKEYVIWYDPDAFKYVVEVYGPTDQLLASRRLECSHEPRFGMDAFDSDRILGQPGELSQLVDSVENQ